MISVTFTKELVGAQDELLRFAYTLTADYEEAHDLRQETSLKALDNEDKYEPHTNFKGWIYTIMRNLFINNYRRVVREQTFVDVTENHNFLKPLDKEASGNTETISDLKKMNPLGTPLPRENRTPS